MDEKRIIFVGLSAPHDKHKVGATLIRWIESEKKLFDPRTWFNMFFASHTFLIYPASPRRPFYMVNEAAGTQVRFMSQRNFESHADILALYEFTFDKKTYDQIKTYSELFAGTPYALSENFGIVLVRLVRLITGRMIRNPFSSGEFAQKCSELVLRNVILRVPGVTVKGLRLSLAKKHGVNLPKDVDNYGVRDIWNVLEFLVEEKICRRVPEDMELKVGDDI